MSIKYLAGIRGDYTSSDQTRICLGNTASNRDTLLKPTNVPANFPIPTLLLTPPVSDEEPEITPPRLHCITSDVVPSVTRTPSLPNLEGLSKEEQIAMLLERKAMLEAYLQALANVDRQVVNGNDGMLQDTVTDHEAHHGTSVEQKPRMTVQKHKVNKLARVRRVRLSIKDLIRHRPSAISHIAYVNTIQVAADHHSMNLSDQDTDEEDEEDDLVFQPVRRSVTPRATVSNTSDDVPMAPDPDIEDRRTRLLQSQLAHLVSHPGMLPTKQQSLPITPKVNHAQISRQLRSLRMKNAIDVGNNPVRYPRGLVTRSGIIAFNPALDTSDGETSITFGDLPVIVAPPPRPEILDRIEAVARSLQEVFPMEAELLEPFVDSPLQGLSMVDIDTIAAGHGQVLWDNGVGKLRLDEEIRQTIPVGNVHIFMDHSNVFLSLMATLRDNPLPELARRQRKVLSLPVLSLILQRGRAVAPKGMHLAGSSPLMQSFDPAIRLGWECSVLKRVPAEGVMYDLRRGAIDDGRPRNENIQKSNPQSGKTSSRDFAVQRRVTNLASAVPAATATSEYDTVSSSDTDQQIAPRIAGSQHVPVYTSHGDNARHTKALGASNSHRMKEQAVDELLHLKILQTILGHRGKRPGTIVLATGDARGGQYNEQGFLGCVREAISRGWNVELWAFKNGMSRSWLDCARREGWLRTGRFAVWTLDHWMKELTQVVE